MVEDPIVQEIHEVRTRLLEEVGGDLKALIEHLRVSEAKDRGRLVSRAPSSKRLPEPRDPSRR